MVSIYLSLRFQIHKDSLRESVIFKREDFNLPVTWRVPIYLKHDFSLPAKREDFNLPVIWRVPIYLKDDFSLPAKREDFNLPVTGSNYLTQWRFLFICICKREDFNLPRFHLLSFSVYLTLYHSCTLKTSRFSQKYQVNWKKIRATRGKSSR